MSGTGKITLFRYTTRRVRSHTSMPNPSDLNPYPGKQYRLHTIWNEGFRIGSRGDPFPMPSDGICDNSIAEQACLEGHKAGREYAGN